jgi:hypothetical protein
MSERACQWGAGVLKRGLMRGRQAANEYVCAYVGADRRTRRWRHYYYFTLRAGIGEYPSAAICSRISLRCATAISLITLQRI